MIRTLSFKPVLSSVALVATVLSLAGCNQSNSSDSESDEPAGTIVLDIPEEGSGEVVLNVKDAQGNFLDDVRVVVIGDEAAGNRVKDASENQLSVAGVIQVRLEDFTGAAIVRVEGEKSGYLSNGARLEVVGGESKEFDLILTSIGNPGEGISVAESTGDVQTGNLAVTVVDTDETGNKPLMSVELPQGIQATTVDGTELSGQLSVTAAHYKSTDTSALAAFPGGFSVHVENPADIDINSIEGNPVDQADFIFQSAGFTAIEVFDEFGNKAENFSGEGIEITMEVAPGSVNPETGGPIQIGDVIPIWSFDTDTANWKFEGKGAVRFDGNDGLEVAFRADHLTYYNLDYVALDNCASSFRVRSSAGGVPNPFPVNVIFTAVAPNVGWTATVSTPGDDGIVQLARAPASMLVNAAFTSGGRSSNSFSFSGNQPIDLCGGGEFDVQFPPVDEALSFVPLTIEVTAQCANDATISRRALRDAQVVYESTTEGIEGRYRSTTDSAGIAQFNVPVGSGKLTVVGAGGAYTETLDIANARLLNATLRLTCPGVVTTGLTGQD